MRLSVFLAVSIVALSTLPAAAVPLPTEPALVVHDAIAAITDRAALRAEVATVGGAPLAGRMVVFAMGTTELGRAPTDAGGRVVVPWLVPEGTHVGANPIEVTVVGTALRAKANLAIVK